jgi:hypothetical protein
MNEDMEDEDDEVMGDGKRVKLELKFTQDSRQKGLNGSEG